MGYRFDQFLEYGCCSSQWCHWRFIYIQIPRTIEGRELSLGEIRAMQVNLKEILKSSFGLDEQRVLQLVQAAQSEKVYEGNFMSKIWHKYLDDHKRVGKSAKP